ncbi:hypothetical protein AK88_05074 [Plasmodium fragile]|uniref:Uncharacterized protein n=1 Tax=Plasmodium fragile TaxID=5857 RepID=A0A0D9QER0_PLAFR|nr:uncharacterized protein AK88_05074 [Plasmodium fragile]KJP85292.1 hypothetical protein AK88_05074 [Plasmodium fragile]
MNKTDEEENNPRGKRGEEEYENKEEKGSAIIYDDQPKENFSIPPCDNHKREGGSESTQKDLQLEASLGEPLHVVNMKCDDVHSIVKYLLSVEREEFKDKCPAQGGKCEGNYDDKCEDAREHAEEDGGRADAPAGTEYVTDPPNVSPQKSQTDHLDKYHIKYRSILNSMVDYICSHPSVNFLELNNNRTTRGSVLGRRRPIKSYNHCTRGGPSHPDDSTPKRIKRIKHTTTTTSDEASSKGCELSWKECSLNDCTCVSGLDPPKRRDDVSCSNDPKGEKSTGRGMGVPYHLAEVPYGEPQNVQKGWPNGTLPPSDISGRQFEREIVPSETTSDYVNDWWRTKCEWGYNSNSNDPANVTYEREKTKPRETHKTQMDNTHKVDTIKARIKTLHKEIFCSLNKLRGGKHRGCMVGGDNTKEENRRAGEDISTLTNKPDRNCICNHFNLVGHLPLYKNTPSDSKGGEVYVHAPCERKKSVIRSLNRIMRTLLPEGRKTILSCVSTDEDMYVWSHVRFADFNYSHGEVMQVGPSCLEPLPSGKTSNYYSSLLYTGKKKSRCKMGKVHDDMGNNDTVNDAANDAVDTIEQKEKIQFYFHIREFTRQQYKINMLGEYLKVKQLTEWSRYLGGDSCGGERGNYSSAHFIRREVHIKRFELLHRFYVQFLRRFYLEGDTSTEEATLVRLKWHMCGVDKCSSDNADQVNPDTSREVGLQPSASARTSITANTPMSTKDISEAREMRLIYRCAKRIRHFLRRVRMDELEKLPLRNMRKIVTSLCSMCDVRYGSFLSHELFRFVFKSAGRRKRVEKERQLDRTEREELPHQANHPRPIAQRRPVKIILKRNIKSGRDPQLEKHFKLDDGPERNGRNGEGMVKHRVEEEAREDSPNGPVVDHPTASTTAPPSEDPSHPNVLIEEVKKKNMIKKKTVQVETKKKTRDKCGRDVKGSDKGKKKRTRTEKTQNDEHVVKKRKRVKSPPGKYLPETDIKNEKGDKQRKGIKTSTYRSKYSRGTASPPSEEKTKRSRLGCKIGRKEASERCIYYVHLKGQLGVYLSPQMEVMYERRNLFFKGDEGKRQPLDMHFDQVFSRVFFSKILPTCVEDVCVRKVSTGSPQRGGDKDRRGGSGSMHSRGSGDRGSDHGRRFSAETSTEKRKNFRERTTSKVHKLKRDQVVTLFKILYQHFYKCFSKLNVCSLLGTYCSDRSVSDGEGSGSGETISQQGDPPREVGEVGEVDKADEAQNAYYYHTFLSSFPPLRDKKTVACAPQDFFKSLNKKFIRTVIYHVNKTLGDFSFIQKLFDENELMERVCTGKIVKTCWDCSDDEATFREEDRYYNVIKDHFVKVIVPFCEENSC